MELMELIYVADPMCSWCYGFGKELSALVARFPDLPLGVVVGGLRAGATDIMDDAARNVRLQHWARVEQASGMPFNREGLLAREDFVYDTEPVCRAVVTARILAGQDNLLAVFDALQHAFYMDALDTTDGGVLAGIASQVLTRLGYGVDAAAFEAAWRAPATVAETQADFALARSWGVTSFPTLLLRVGRELHGITTGYASAGMIEHRLASVLEQMPARA
ncbi:DsbA family protein [Cupriavidus basilensis]|uniref:DsbA family protein n=1 Tax=Cupriavidus basilensis TaxID=68895 RepID=UPI00320464D5